MRNRLSKSDPLQIFFAILALAFVVTLAAPLQAQTFQTIPALDFTMPFAGANPLPQIVTAASTGSTIEFTQAVTTSSGGNWLSASPCDPYGCDTPQPVAVSISGAGLAAGTYQGQIVFTDAQNSAIALTVPVTLTVAASTVAFFDSLPGGLSFSFQTKPTATTPQPIQIRNAGSGTLSWTLTASTGIGSGWLKASASSGTAPSTISISITPGNLPGGGATAGTYIGELLLKTSGDSVTIPIAVTVGNPVFEQINPITFTMPVGGANALSQILTIESTNNSAIEFTQGAYTANGGNWLSVSPCNPYDCDTPQPITVSIQNASSLAAGTYMGEVVVTQAGSPALSVTVPVTLNILSSGAFFNSLPGGLSFSLKTNGTATSQVIQIGNGGSGTLSWAVAQTTSDGGNWLTMSSSSGTAPSLATVEVNASLLPNGGAVAGTYVGQLLFQTSGDTVTIPVAVTVGTAVFEQLNPITFTMPVGGTNPAPQILTIESTNNSAIEFTQVSYTSNGGSWVSVSPCNPYGCDTPQPITVTIQNASSLPAGTYMGEVVVTQTGSPALSVTVPVTLTIESSGAFFANLPGALSFSMPQDAKAVTAQTLQVGGAGSGKLKFAITPSTADGGAWLAVSPASSTAPKAVTVSIVPKNLPEAGAAAGTFVGQLLLEAGEDTTTIPVTVTVGAAPFTQLNPIDFVMPVGGANPLPQLLTVATVNGATVEFTQETFTATGGNWLTVSPCNPYGCNTSYPLAVTVDNASSLPAGTYTGEVTVIQTGSPAMSMTVPVTLSVVSTSKAFFDNLPGGMSFSFAPDSKTTPSQTVQIGNGGAGTLDWSVSTNTADTGKWVKVTPTKGTNAGSYDVSVTIKSLPNEGKVAGTFLGQQVLKATTGDVTIPVVVTVGNPVFVQLPIVTFTTTQGTSPAPQSIPVDSTGAAIEFTQVTSTGKGGDWLSVSPCNPYGCDTPTNLTVSVNASALTAGTYFAEINITQAADPAETMTIPVVLTVTAAEDKNGESR
jgi:hypothetical protein